MGENEEKQQAPGCAWFMLIAFAEIIWFIFSFVIFIAFEHFGSFTKAELGRIMIVTLVSESSGFLQLSNEEKA